MRLEQLTFTRFLAAISIVIFHFGMNTYPFNHESLSFVFWSANYSVSYFFILSGYVMVLAYDGSSKVNYLEYLKNRLARVYPVYFLALILMFLALVLTEVENKYDGVLLNVFMLQAWVPGKAMSFNGAAWSLSVEMFFYLIFPVFINVVYKSASKSLLLSLITFIWLLTQLILHLILYSKYYQGFATKSHDVIFYFPIMHLNEFLIGNVAGLYFMSKFSNVKKHFDVLIILVVGMVLVAFKFPMGMTYHNGILALLLVPLLWLISMNKGIVTCIFKLKPLVFLGEISFGVYILQGPVYIIISKMVLDYKIELGEYQFYYFLAVLVTIASISYLLIEAPLRRLIRKIKMPIL